MALNKSALVGNFTRKKKRKQKIYTKKYMDSYIAKKATNMFRKLKAMKRGGTYKVSESAQIADARLRMLYRKFNKKEGVYHSDARWVSKLSQSDTRILFDAVRSIEKADLRALRTKLNITRKRFKEEKEEINKKRKEEGLAPISDKVTFDSTFEAMSRLSSEFHEVFAFLSYNDIQTRISNGGTIKDILSEYTDVLEDKILTDKQKYAKGKLETKIMENFNADELDDIYNRRNSKEKERNFKSFFRF